MSASRLNDRLRFLWPALFLALAVLFLQLRSRAEVVPQHKPLAEFPQRLGDWIGRDVPIPANFLAVLGPGDFLTREYVQPQARVPGMNLYIAYFPSQRQGDTIHSPKNCLPGAGWVPLTSTHMYLQQTGGPPLQVNRYVLGEGSERMFVLYWYQAHGRAVASEYTAKFYLVADSIRLNRTDGALVRILTPVATRIESVEDAERRAVSFASLLIPRLDDYIPR